MILQARFFYGLADADHVGGRAALEALDVRMGLDDFLGLFVGFLGIVKGFALVDDHLHVRVLGQLLVDAAVGPLVVGDRAKAANKDGILALFAHQRRQAIHETGAEGHVVEGLDVPVHILLIGAFVGDYRDAGFHGFLEHGIELAGPWG